MQTEAAAATTAPAARPPRNAGKYERLALARHQRDLELAAQPGGHPRGFTFDAAAGERPVTFVESYCRHHKGKRWAGKLVKLEDWQKDLIRQAFGWKNADGTRRFRTCYWAIPRKNGKSQIAAALGLYLTIADGEPGAEVYVSATKKDQAKIVWSAAAAMVKKSPELKRWVKAYRDNLSCERMESKFEPLGADSETLDGINPHGNLVDELHAHKDRGLWNVMDSAMGSREQPMTIAITTAGKNDGTSVGFEMHEYAMKVLEGVIEDDSFHAIIYAADPPPKDRPDYYYTLEAQLQANPNVGVSIMPDYLPRQAAKARAQPSFNSEYLQKHLNVYTEGGGKWLELEAWAACEPALVHHPNVRALALEREQQLRGRRCYAGLDLSAKLDLSALVLVFPDEKCRGCGGQLKHGAAACTACKKKPGYDLICRFWLPERTVKKFASKNQKHFETWGKEGWLTVTPGGAIDYDHIKAELVALKKLYDIVEVGYDSWGATQLAIQLAGEEGFVMVEVGQGYKSLSEPSKAFEAEIVEAQVRHAGNPVLRYCVSNVVVAKDKAGNIKPDKEKAKLHIDGVVATIIAKSRIVGAKPPPPKSVYETRGILML